MSVRRPLLKWSLVRPGQGWYDNFKASDFVSWIYYVALNRWMAEWYISERCEWSSRDLLKVLSLYLPWRIEENHKELMVHGIWTENQSWSLLNTKHECWLVNHNIQWRKDISTFNYNSETLYYRDGSCAFFVSDFFSWKLSRINCFNSGFEAQKLSVNCRTKNNCKWRPKIK
jgi:hypothetical protein